jgi:hypothetical protein
MVEEKDREFERVLREADKIEPVQPVYPHKTRLFALIQKSRKKEVEIEKIAGQSV